MAQINLIPNKRKLNKIHNTKENNLIHSTIYNTSTWKKLRISYLTNNPVCEKCKDRLAIDVHHIIYLSIAGNITELKRLGFDENNLMAVCKDCHKEIHNNINLW